MFVFPQWHQLFDKDISSVFYCHKVALGVQVFTPRRGGNILDIPPWVGIPAAVTCGFFEDRGQYIFNLLRLVGWLQA